MKIFNWMHRRSLNVGPTSSASLHPQKVKMINKQEVEMKKEGSMVMKLSVPDREEALLEWREGLLAIGTLGFPYAHHPPHPDFILNPRLSFRNSSNSVYDNTDSVSDDQEYLDATTNMSHITGMLAGENDDEDPLVLNADYNDQHEIEADGQNEIVALAPFQHVEAADLHDISSHSVKSDRTTLSDLFQAEPNDSIISKNCQPKWASPFKDQTNEDKQIMGKQRKFPTSFSTKLFQKLIPGGEVQPIKNITHMMRKMVKRKTHPELPRNKSTTNKMENQEIRAMPCKDETELNEDMPLLQSAENMLVLMEKDEKLYR